MNTPRVLQVFLSVHLCAALHAQCGEWRIDAAAPGLAGAEQILASGLWDPDGPGPAGPLLAVGGMFSRAGDVQAGKLAIYDPGARTWSRLGTGFNGAVRAVAGMPDGTLVAGGDFFEADGIFFRAIARWDGAAWSGLAGGLDDRVAALVVLPNGDLVAGGHFTSSAGTPMARVARWDGTSWSPLGAGLSGPVYALAVDANGDVYAGGEFTSSGAMPVNYVARWDGSSWSSLAGGTSARVLSLAILANGDLVCGGPFASASGSTVNSIARWDGANWHDLGGGVAGGIGTTAPEVQTVTAMPNGDVMAGGLFTMAGSVAAERIARWDGAQWHALGSGLTRDSQTWVTATTAAVLPGGDLFVAGVFTEAGGVVVRDAARWSPAGWQTTNPGTEGRVGAILERSDGDVIVGGTFRTLGGVQTNNVVRWDGAQWHALGNGIGGLTYSEGVSHFAELPGGDLVAAGLIYEQTSPNSIAPGNPVWRWDGSAWTPLGGGVEGQISAMERLSDGRLAIAGAIASAGGTPVGHVAIWNGATWEPLGSGIGAPVYAMVEMDDGSLAVSGRFTSAGGVSVQNVARWDGSAWSPLGSGVPIDGRIQRLANGDLVVYEPSPPAAYRWDGSSWAPLTLPPMTLLNDLAPLPNGDLAISGYTFVGANQPRINDLWRGDGSTWSSMVPAGSEFVFGGVPLTPFSGGLWVGGAMVDASGRYGQLSRFASLCPATTSSIGSGCSGSAGVPLLEAETPPWIGSTYRSRCTGLAAATIAIEVLGLQTNEPLPAILRPGSASCALLATQDIVSFQLVDGEVTNRIAIPSAPAFVGTQVVEQIVAVELTAAGGIARTAASQGLLLTLGTY